ncbi:MAG: dephospho-CoA kinase [Armatimonadota bacterium]
MLRVAVTGGICDGKTTILALVREAGFPTFSADEVAAAILREPEFLSKVTDAFGDEATSDDGLDKEFIRASVLPDPARRRRLNSIAHAETLRRLLAAMSASDRLSFAEVPLLIETGAHRYFDAVWVVVSSPEEQVRRLTERLGDREAAERSLAVQLPTRAKIPFGDRILRTVQPVSSVRLQVETALDALATRRLRW